MSVLEKFVDGLSSGMWKITGLAFSHTTSFILRQRQKLATTFCARTYMYEWIDVDWWWLMIRPVMTMQILDLVFLHWLKFTTSAKTLLFVLLGKWIELVYGQSEFFLSVAIFLTGHSYDHNHDFYMSDHHQMIIIIIKSLGSTSYNDDDHPIMIIIG